ncbi:MAG: Ig-like domain-containing protein [Fibrobacterales bacterium]
MIKSISILTFLVFSFLIVNCAEGIEPLAAEGAGGDVGDSDTHISSEANVDLQSEMKGIYDSIADIDANLADSSAVSAEVIAKLKEKKESLQQDLIATATALNDQKAQELSDAQYDHAALIANGSGEEELANATEEIRLAQEAVDTTQKLVDALTDAASGNTGSPDSPPMSSDQVILSSEIIAHVSSSATSLYSSQTVPDTTPVVQSSVQAISSGETQSSSSSVALSSDLSIESSVVSVSSSDALSSSSMPPSSAQIVSSSSLSSSLSVPAVSSSSDVSSSSSLAIPNTAPIITEGESIVESHNEDDTVSVTITGSDAEGDALTWLVVTPALNGAVVISGAGTSPQVIYQPEDNYSGEVLFSVAVSDGEFSDTIPVTLTLQPVNDAPNYTGPATIKGDLVENATLTLDVGSTCTDVETANPTLSYKWYKGSIGGVDEEKSSIGTHTLMDTDVGSYYYVIVQCTDDEGVVTSDTSSHTAVIKETHGLTLQNVSGGTVDGALTRVVVDGESESISVTLASGYGFTRWSKVSGTGVVTFGDATAASTTVSLISGDAIIAPSFNDDIEVPTVPAGLRSVQSMYGDAQFSLEWNSATDNKGVIGYNVYINDSFYSMVTTPSVIIASADRDFSKFSITALDAAGNESDKSKSVYHIEMEHADRYENCRLSSYYVDELTSGKKEKLFFENKTLSAGSYSMKVRMADNSDEYNANQIMMYWNEQQASNKYVTQVASNNHNTGGWNNWIYEYSDAQFSLDTGTGTLWFLFEHDNFNIDWVELIEK